MELTTFTNTTTTTSYNNHDHNHNKRNNSYNTTINNNNCKNIKLFYHMYFIFVFPHLGKLRNWKVVCLRFW